MKTFVFSSSAIVYGDPASLPIREDFPRSANNPYGRSKLIIEDILADLYHAEPDWRIARLRYFNPVPFRPSPSRRYRTMLGRSYPRQPIARLESTRGLEAMCANAWRW